MELKYLLFGGKGSKGAYYAKRYLTLFIPNCFYRWHRKKLLSKFEKMTNDEKEYIYDRVNYYCKLNKVSGFAQLPETKSLADHKLSNKKKRGYASVYFFDTYEYTRSLSKNLRWAYRFGDVFFTLPLPSITKSRPIVEDNQNSVLLKLNKLRHFIVAKDIKSYDEKMDKCVFRGNIAGKKCRLDFVSKFYNSELCNTGDVCNSTHIPQEWKKPKMTLPEQMEYKFIVTLEGNDVASNLKWVMSSNSVAVMPRPTCETWFMEGRLIPDYHYIEVADDYSDFEEKINYYIAHPDEAKKIVSNAHEYWSQFQNSEREDIISHLVLEKYFTQTGQINK